MTVAIGLSGWLVAAMCAGALFGMFIRCCDRADEQRRRTSDLDLIDLDEPYEVLTPADQLRYVERMWTR